MRILHTSDWHVGRTFHGYSTISATQQVLAEFPALIKTHQIDVVIVAGDIYDLTNPAPDAVETLRDALKNILATGAKIVMTAGNHDSATRLGFAGAFSALAGLHLITDAALIGTPVQLQDEHGAIDFYGIPFLQPDLMRHLDWVPDDSRTQNQVVSAAMDVVRTEIAKRKLEKNRSVVIAHTFVAGAESESSDSERAITKEPLVAGGVDSVPVKVFNGPDYVALGHIHSRKELGNHIRYSGAILHNSFKEANKPRGGWLVDLNRDGLGDVVWIDLPIPRDLVEIRGTFAELLGDEKFEDFREHYVRAVYTDKTREIEPMAKLKNRFKWCAKVDWEPSSVHEESTTSYREKIQGKSDLEIIASFLVDNRNGDGASKEELVLIEDVIAEYQKSRMNS